MPDYSAHYNLITLGPGEQLSSDDYAFTRRNIVNLDNKAYLGAEGHHHTGASPAVTDPTDPLAATLVTGSGGIPGGRTVRYKYTWVDQYGQETGASPEVTVNTPAPVSPPSAPTVTRGTSGTLLPGNYFYVLTAWKDANTLETTVGNKVYTTLAYGSGYNSILVSFPTLPAGADGFNIYRRSPGSLRYQFLYSADLSVAIPPTEWEDTGSVTEDCNRTIPNRNTTAASNYISLSLPGATPSVPDGYTWKIYRTYTSGDWDSSLLHWTVEETTEGSGIITPSYDDVGRSTTSGRYPDHSEIAGSPSKVLLTDMTEVEGSLPPGASYYPHEVMFTFAGYLEADTGTFQWTMPFTDGRVEKIVASLGKDSAPASTDVQVDVRKYDGVWSSVTASPVAIPVGDNGVSYTLTGGDDNVLASGDKLTVDLVQAGGGATPTDFDLTVQIVMWVNHGSSTVSFTW